MLRTIFFFLITFTAYSTLLFGQTDDPVLFTVEGNPIHVSEFEYIYSKTNGEKANFSKESLKEYLDLYVKFKLKVQRAKDMQLDTIPSLKQELEGYRKQLANSYLIDKEVTDKLVKEAYDRIQKDVHISHILFATQPKASSDTVKAYERAMEAMKRLNKGEKFEDVAKEMSDDKNSKDNGGQIGYITALLPSGFYQLENLSYSLKPGEFGGPARTKLGYHIVKVNEVRPARGEMEAAHILLRKNDERSEEEATALINNIHQALLNGASFDSLAAVHSEDKLTAKKGGYIGTFGINRYEKTFEDAAFNLKKDEDFSMPVKTSVGWHIIKRVDKKALQEFAVEKRRLQARIQRDSRFENAKTAMVERIKTNNQFKENEKALQTFIDSLDQQFLTYKWQEPKFEKDQTLFTLGKDSKFSTSAFSEFCKKSTRTRLRSGSSDPAEVCRSLYEEFIEESCLKFEETQLETKYPEFKSLMREYQEGILLFEATKMLVWDKASQDTTGLKAYFPRVSRNYRWKERARVSEYILEKEAADQIDKVRNLAVKKAPLEVLEKFNTPEKRILSFQENTYEKNRNAELDKIDWKPGYLTETRKDPRDQSLRFMKIEEILPPTEKTLDEARGYVIADYQDYLEREWVKELKDTYKVKINEDVFNSMIKK